MPAAKLETTRCVAVGSSTTPLHDVPDVVGGPNRARNAGGPAKSTTSTHRPASRVPTYAMERDQSATTSTNVEVPVVSWVALTTNVAGASVSTALSSLALSSLASVLLPPRGSKLMRPQAHSTARTRHRTPRSRDQCP